MCVCVCVLTVQSIYPPVCLLFVSLCVYPSSRPSCNASIHPSTGVCNLIATILLLVSISKIKEKSKLTRFQTLEASDEL